MAVRPEVVDLRHADDSRAIIHRAVELLADGRLVAFPTETVYGVAASALDEGAVERLKHVKGRPADKPVTLVVKSAEEALGYVPDMSKLGRRLARRCWPGPVTLVFNHSAERGLIRRLPEGVRKAVLPNGTLGLRVPAHDAVLDVLSLLPGPIVLSSANRAGGADATTAEEVVEALAGDVDLVLDDGPSRYAQPSTVVRVQDESFTILREGVVSRRTLRRLANVLVVFVCTGNTCRSPMAEAIFRKMLADRVGCAPEALEEHGYVVISAGVSAVMGCRPTPEAVQVLAERGIALDDHVSQPLTGHMITQADHIYAMTRSHRESVLMEHPDAAGRVELLARDGGDIHDPIGGTTEEYRRCADMIQANLREIVESVDR